MTVETVKTMAECERQFGADRGAEIKLLIEDATGQPCPCSTGGQCPLRRAN